MKDINDEDIVITTPAHEEVTGWVRYFTFTLKGVEYETSLYWREDRGVELFTTPYLPEEADEDSLAFILDELTSMNEEVGK